MFWSRVLYKLCIVGGLIDGTSGTLSPPDLDLNVEWHINREDLLNLLQIRTLDEGASGQYQLKVTKRPKQNILGNDKSSFFRSWQIVRTYFWRPFSPF